MSEPSQEQFDIAALWLESNEGEGDERAACFAVAEWLRQKAYERMLRSEARNAGITVAILRHRLAIAPQSSSVARGSGES